MIPVELSKKEVNVLRYVLKNHLTMVSRERLIATAMACKYVAACNIDGAFVECGVWRGGNSIVAAAIFALQGVQKDIYLFDTFKGMTEPEKADTATSDGSAAIETYRAKQTDTHNDWCFSSLDEVKENFRKAGLLSDKIHFIQGDVSETLSDNRNLPSRISVLRLDTDWYASTKQELEVLYPRLSVNGALILDDYGHWDGMRKAVDEYFQKHNNRPLFHVTDYAGRVGVKDDGTSNTSTEASEVELAVRDFPRHYTCYYQKDDQSVFNSLCDTHGSDKGEITPHDNPYPWPSHSYADFIERYFGHCREYIQHIFECGIGTNNTNYNSHMGANGRPGASLRVWRDYFPNAKVVGADIDQGTLFEDDRIRSFYCDQTDPKAISDLWEQANVAAFDLMIDDGLHTFDAGVCLLENSFHKLKTGGLYIIEDVTDASLAMYNRYFRSTEFRYDFIRLTKVNEPQTKDNSLVVIRKPLT